MEHSQWGSEKGKQELGCCSMWEVGAYSRPVVPLQNVQRRVWLCLARFNQQRAVVCRSRVVDRELVYTAVRFLVEDADACRAA